MKALDYIPDMTTKLIYKKQFAPDYYDFWAAWV